MSGTVKNVILLVVLVAAAALAGWFFYRGDPEKSAPNTAESKTEWMCFYCKKRIDLTARQVQDWLASPDKVRRGEQYDPKLIVFWCDDCKKFSVLRAFHCKEHDIWFCGASPEGTMQDCPECRKAMR